MVCNECRWQFKKWDAHGAEVVKIGYRGLPYVDDAPCCPLCGSIDLREGWTCDRCDGEIEGKFYDLDDERVCPECAMKWRTIVPESRLCDGCLTRVSEGYTIDNIFYCDDCFEGFASEEE